MSAKPSAEAQRWLQASEVGSMAGLRFLVIVATAFGRAPVHLLLRVIVFYYALFARQAMRACRQYRVRMGLPHGFWACYGQVLRFAQCATDRWFFVRGRSELFEINTHGNDLLVAAKQSGRGAVLLGAHLGSFEAMHAAGQREGFVINVVGYFRNAARINQLLASFGGGVQTRLLEIDPGNINFVLRLRQCIERGEFVALLADRVVAGSSEEVQFLGAPARFPTGAYVLAAALRCPVYITFGLFHAPRRYELYCEPFADPLLVPRADRPRALREHAQRFAERLGEYCQLAPDNWFNFYDFWSHDG